MQSPMDKKRREILQSPAKGGRPASNILTASPGIPGSMLGSPGSAFEKKKQSKYTRVRCQ